MFKPSRSSIPTEPGVYIYKNSKGEIIYVGKAKNLRNRVMSYFTSDHKTSPKTQFLVRNIEDMEYIVVDSEVEALLLENRLIKKHSPKYNISLKDSKTYAYIKLTNEPIPKLTTVRNITKGGEYFGPFTDGYYRIQLFNLTVRIFKLVTRKTYSTKSRLNYDIGMAPAPSIEEIDKEEYMKNVGEAKNFLNGKNTKSIVKKLQLEMEEAIEKTHYEIAREKKTQIDSINFLKEKQKVDLVKNYDQHVIAGMRDGDKFHIQLFKISKGVISGRENFNFEFTDEIFQDFIKMYYSQKYVPREIITNENFKDEENSLDVVETYLSKIKGTKVSITNPKRGEKLSLLRLAQKNIESYLESGDPLDQIKERLSLPRKPEIIECFDMSNLGSEYLVGAMTRWVGGKPDKDNYRRYEIKSFKGKNDDYRSMREVVYRRYSGIKEKVYEKKKREDVPEVFPNLIIIDGGKGQLGAAKEALEKLRLDIPIISLAKREEEIFMPYREKPLKFPKESQMMLLIRRIRDSVHNYVLSYNRKKRSMRFKEQTEK